MSCCATSSDLWQCKSRVGRWQHSPRPSIHDVVSGLLAGSSAAASSGTTMWSTSWRSSATSCRDLLLVLRLRQLLESPCRRGERVEAGGATRALQPMRQRRKLCRSRAPPTPARSPPCARASAARTCAPPAASADDPPGETPPAGRDCSAFAPRLLRCRRGGACLQVDRALRLAAHRADRPASAADRRCRPAWSGIRCTPHPGLPVRSLSWRWPSAR